MAKSTNENYVPRYARGGKLSKDDAIIKALKMGVDFDKDFHAQSFGNELSELAKESGYRKSKSASGSTGRAFFEHLERIYNKNKSYYDDMANDKYSWGGGIAIGGILGGYLGYKIGRARPQKFGFDTERKIGQGIKKTFSKKKKMAKGGGVWYRGKDMDKIKVGDIVQYANSNTERQAKVLSITPNEDFRELSDVRIQWLDAPETALKHNAFLGDLMLSKKNYARGGGVESKNYIVELRYIGLPIDESMIGKPVMSEETLDRLEDEFKYDITFTPIDETKMKPLSYEDSRKFILDFDRNFKGRLLGVRGYAKGGGVGKFQVGDKIKLTLKGLQQFNRNRSISDFSNKFSQKLGKFYNANKVGQVEYVFDSGSMNVLFDNTTYHIYPYMVEKVYAKGGGVGE